jgi:hypothetical protein
LASFLLVKEDALSSLEIEAALVTFVRDELPPFLDETLLVRLPATFDSYVSITTRVAKRVQTFVAAITARLQPIFLFLVPLALGSPFLIIKAGEEAAISDPQPTGTTTT